MNMDDFCVRKIRVLLLLSLLYFTESSRYDRSITIFSPDGKLEQVEYAEKAVHHGAPAMALTNQKDSIVVCYGVANQQERKLQNPSESQKFMKIDEHIFLTYAGLKADGRVLAQKARLECQQYRFSMGEAPSVEYIATRIADIQHSYTRRPGARPFGVGCLVVGFDAAAGGAGGPRIFRVDPSGYLAEWSGVCVGRDSSEIQTRLTNEQIKLKESDCIGLSHLGLRVMISAQAQCMDFSSSSDSDEEQGNDSEKENLYVKGNLAGGSDDNARVGNEEDNGKDVITGGGRKSAKVFPGTKNMCDVFILKYSSQNDCLEKCTLFSVCEEDNLTEEMLEKKIKAAQWSKSSICDDEITTTAI